MQVECTTRTCGQSVKFVHLCVRWSLMQACEHDEWDLGHNTAAITATSFRIYLELLVALSPLESIHVTNVLTPRILCNREQ
jgi:hypothetical protein